jgi:hypothetical protein
VSPPAHLLQWGRGCKCHEAERLQGKTIKCNKSGRRGPEYANRLLQFFAELRALRDRFSGEVSLISELGGTLCRQGASVTSVMLSDSKLKFAWVFQPPYTIWQCDHPPKAAKFLETVQIQIASKDKNLHRVSCFFTVEEDGCHGTDMRRHARGEGCSAGLRTAMTSYQFLGLVNLTCTNQQPPNPNIVLANYCIDDGQIAFRNRSSQLVSVSLLENSESTFPIFSHND